MLSKLQNKWKLVILLFSMLSLLVSCCPAPVSTPATVPTELKNGACFLQAGTQIQCSCPDGSAVVGGNLFTDQNSFPPTPDCPATVNCVDLGATCTSAVCLIS